MIQAATGAVAEDKAEEVSHTACLDGSGQSKWTLFPEYQVSPLTKGKF
jgi:hypothetical protein